MSTTPTQKSEGKTRWITGTVSKVTPTKDGKSVCAVFDTETAKKTPGKEGAKANYSFTVFFPADQKAALEKAIGSKKKVKAWENPDKETGALKFQVTAGLVSSFTDVKDKAAPEQAM